MNDIFKTKATIVNVDDWSEWCWDVGLSFGDCGLCVQFPRNHKPEIGDIVEYPQKGMVIWRGIEVIVDVRPLIVQENGDLKFG